ncbi:hypothetical protein C1Y40_02103 [Mycobacterium talmoniae]|uniref:Uncharacterized protein n=1 Tax=Mycobacterium talmoniae TaxID=1858794 RepID=A0A2S8BLY8_9MYCO|nr:hypothetical protein C1Y40_02103 [Mycobacterium talmoniae]
MPIATPATANVATDTVSNPPATLGVRPCAFVKYGSPHISANTVIANWVPMWVKNPSRVPGRDHTALMSATVLCTVRGSATTSVPCGVSRTSASVNTIDNTPSAAAAA